MDVYTTRFGTLTVPPQDELLFDQGLVGLEDCHRWVVLTDSDNPTLGWLQSIEHGHVALGLVSPRRFVPEYQLRVDRDSLATLQLETVRDAEVVVIASRQPTGLTLNLRAPLVINVDKKLGCQVIAKDAHPVQFPLVKSSVQLRRSA
jgi:flagellar assembly factor FliW